MRRKSLRRIRSGGAARECPAASNERTNNRKGFGLARSEKSRSGSGRLIEDLAEVAARQRVPPVLRSCHTGVMGDYIVEGHVPAGAIRRVLDDGPDLAGVAVRGMPAGASRHGGTGPDPVRRVWIHGGWKRTPAVPGTGLAGGPLSG